MNADLASCGDAGVDANAVTGRWPPIQHRTRAWQQCGRILGIKARLHGVTGKGNIILAKR